MESIVYRLIREGKYNIKQLADRLGVSENYLYKMSLPEWNDAYCDVPFRKLLAIAKHQGEIVLARWIAREFGGVFVKLPRVAKDRRDENAMVNDYQEVTNHAAKEMMDYFDKPSEEGRRAVIAALDDVMSKSAGIRKRCVKREINQPELFDL